LVFSSIIKSVNQINQTMDSTETTMDASTKASPQSFVRKWGVLFVLGLAIAIIVIDTTLLNVSISVIIKDLHTNLQALQWVIAAYALALAALTITGGRLGDLFGRKKMFMLGAVIFAVGSFMASISHSVAFLLIGESIIEGIGAALMLPATASLLVATYKGRERAIAFGIWGGIAAAASAIGPILGGFLTSHYSWRYGFRINIVIAAILLIGSVLIKESRDEEEKPTLDWVGVILSSTGLFALVFGIIEASTYGWIFAKSTFAIGSFSLPLLGLSVTPVAVGLGIILLASFIFWEKQVERKGETPLVSMKLFQNNQFTSGAITSMLVAISFTGLTFTLPVFLQSVQRLDALHTGYMLLPMSVSLLVFSPLGVALSKKFTPKRIIQAGLILSALSFLILRQVLSESSTSFSLSIPLLIFGMGAGLVFSQVNNLTLSAVSVAQAGEASGVTNTLRQVGTSLGAALLGAVLLSSLTSHLQTGIQNSPNIPGQLKPVIESSVKQNTSALEFGNFQAPANVPPQIANEVTKISKRATTEANKTALIYAFIFGLIGVVASVKLPNVRDLERKESLAAAH
jgi:EmrB/QacA subfamily drug resistance transporter